MAHYGIFGDKAGADSFRSWMYRQRPENRARKAERARQWRAANPERWKAITKRYQPKKNAARRADRAVNPEKHRAAELRRRHAVPGREAERVAARRTRLLQATPAWVDREEIRKIYRLAAVLGMQVDHIHPLKGRNFCGLHVPWNLQLLAPSANAAKGNRLVDVV